MYILWSSICRFKVLLPLLLILQTGCATVEQLSCIRHKHEPEEKYPLEKLQSGLGQNPVIYEDESIRISRSVYRIGPDNSKPPVILLHEITGLSSKTLEYAEALSADFTVYVPELFGEANQNSTVGGIAAFLFNGEWDGPFGRSTLDRNTPIVRWLRHVAAEIEKEHKGQPMGVVGNCLTGILPLLLLANNSGSKSSVNAVVLAQPTLPIRIFYFTESDYRSLGISDSELKNAKRIVSESDTKIYGVRFEKDCSSNSKKQETLKSEFGDNYVDATILESEYMRLPRCQAEDCKKAHSTLIGEWKGQDSPSESRRNEVLKYLKNPSTFTRPISP